MDGRRTQYLDKPFQYGMHACGFVHDIMFNNSLEALEYWHSRGVSVFEVDVDDTGEGKFVACHNFCRETFFKMEIEDIPERCTCEWFKEQKLYKKTTGGLTPMTLEDLIGLLKKYPDLLLMIDPKVYSCEETETLLGEIQKFTERFHVDGKRIIFETYNEDMIRATRRHSGLAQWQYCVDDEMQMGTSEAIRAWDMDALIGYLKENEIWILSYPWKFAVERLDRMKRFQEEGFVMFSKTRNDILADLLQRAGVNVNIIDHLVTPEQRIMLEGYQQEYAQKYEAQIRRIFDECE